LGEKVLGAEDGAVCSQTNGTIAHGHHTPDRTSLVIGLAASAIVVRKYSVPKKQVKHVT
jgi:hypothetical protein